MNLEKEFGNIFLIVIAIISMLTLIFIIGSNFTGFVTYEETIILNNNSNFGSENINFSDSEMKLNLYQENIIQDNLYYIDKSIYEKNDVSDLIKFEDSNGIELKNEERLEIELDDKKFINGLIVSLKIINGSESEIMLCRSEGVCTKDINNLGSTLYTNPGYYNITIKNQGDEKLKLHIKGNITVDYIYVIEENTSISNKYSNQGYIETEINNFNSVIPNYNLNDQSIDFYYLDNETWKELDENVLDTKLRIVFNSNSTVTPVLYNLSLSYNVICNENYICSNWSICENNTKIRTCEDTNCNTGIKNESEFCNDTIEIPVNDSNITIPATPSSSGGSSGGSGGGSSKPKVTPTETRTLEKSTEITNPVESQDTSRVLEKPIDHCNNRKKDYDETKVDCGGSCKKCISILTILPYSNYMLFILLLLVVITLLKKGTKE